MPRGGRETPAPFELDAGKRESQLMCALSQQIRIGDDHDLRRQVGVPCQRDAKFRADAGGLTGRYRDEGNAGCRG
jgi:hypothetical protein